MMKLTQPTDWAPQRPQGFRGWSAATAQRQARKVADPAASDFLMSDSDAWYRERLVLT
jgi:hypothetical protein